MSAQTILIGLLLLTRLGDGTRYFDPQVALDAQRRDLEIILLADRRPCTLVLSATLLEDDRRLDDWSNEYLFLCVDDHVAVISAGPDGLFGTFDDRGSGTLWCAWPNVTDRSRSSCRRRCSPS